MDRTRHGRSVRTGLFAARALLLCAGVTLAFGLLEPATALAKESRASSAAAGSAPGSFMTTERLRRQIMDAIAGARLGTATVGISVRDCASRDEIIAVQPDSAEKRQFIPASNLKLVTSGVAILALGKDHEFKTSLVLQGNRLVIRGTGDPAMGDPVLLEALGVSSEQFIDTLVNSVLAAGATRVDEIIIDDRVFDRELVHPEWPADQLGRAYCAPVSGLNFHANVLNLYATPAGRVGDPPVIRTDPSANWLEIDKRNARTVGEGNTQIWIQHGASPTRFILHGSVRAAIKEPVQVTFKDPALIFGRLLAEGLASRRVGARPGADGRPQAALVRFAEPNENLTVPANLERVAAVVRTPLEVVLERCNVDSDNLYAECLLKAAANKLTGQPGSWRNGTAAARMMIKDRLGPEAAASIVMSDGSGLSRGNRLTVGLMTRWLAEVAEDPATGGMFVESIAKAGEEGTLKSRFKKARLATEVRAKSGYIRQVRTLSGYLTEPLSGRRIAFSVMVNDVPSGADQRAKDLHERVVELLDTWLHDQCARRNAPAPVASPSSPSENIGG